MESVVGQAVGRQAVDIGCGDVCTEATQLGETGVVEQDDEHIRGSGRGAGQNWMLRRRIGNGEPLLTS